MVCRSDRKLKSIAIVSIQVDTLEETDGVYGIEHDNLLKQAEYKQEQKWNIDRSYDVVDMASSAT